MFYKINIKICFMALNSVSIYSSVINENIVALQKLTLSDPQKIFHLIFGGDPSTHLMKILKSSEQTDVPLFYQSRKAEIFSRPQGNTPEIEKLFVELFTRIHPIMTDLWQNKYANLKVHSQSVAQLLKGIDHLVVYGWEHCCYEAVGESLRKHYGMNVYNYLLGDPLDEDFVQGKLIRKLQIQDDDTENLCKATLVNIVFHSVLAVRQNQPLIPILFITKNSDQKHSCNARTIASREPKENAFVTNKELRRCYKLCHHKDPEIAEIAKKSFIFAEITHQRDSNDCVLRPIAPFWEERNWKSCWSQRQATKTNGSKQYLENGWGTQLDKFLEEAKTHQ